ncbi:MAG: hypothetical protein AB1716_01835 [Planctomycetota bacterium]
MHRITRTLRCGRLPWGGLFAAVLIGVLAARAPAQEHPEPAGTPLPPGSRVLTPWSESERAVWLADLPRGRACIMLTGYWPPTNEMLRPFSPNPAQNPTGWIGENWEDRGYNVYAFFPEFPHGLGKGEGDFEVDYQDTLADFRDIVELLHPVAINTYGRAFANNDWRIEWRLRNLPYAGWYDDYLAPTRPTPVPPDGTVPANHVRYASLPVDAIATAVNGAGLGIHAWVNTNGDAGAFLCEYVGYHAAWYRDQHITPPDPFRAIAGGHIHVGSLVDASRGFQAVQVTVRTLIAYLDAQRTLRGDLNCDGAVNFDDINAFVLRLSDPEQYALTYGGCPDANGDASGDGMVNFSDINPFVALLSGD